jgi:hypothetical protein
MGCHLLWATPGQLRASRYLFFSIAFFFPFLLPRYGYHSLVVKRTEFCEILIKRMGSHRIQWGRKVLEVVNGNAGVQCRCANNHVEQGDIIVGAGMYIMHMWF